MNSLKLAKEGGEPIRKNWLPYARQTIDDADIESVASVLRQEIITRGPRVEAFEKALAERVEMPYGLAFNSATAALHAAMSLYGVREGVEVVTTPNTFVATSNAVLYCQGKVRFSDISQTTMNLDPQKLMDLQSAKIVVAVDYAGNPCDYNELSKLQKKYGFKLVADASHSLGGSYDGKAVGSLADLSVFSFHPVKSITTGEGGFVVCKDKSEFEYLKKFRSHGIDRNSSIPGYYEQELLGFNYNVTDLHAVLGLSQLKKLNQFVKRRTEIAAQYSEYFRDSDFVEVPHLTPKAKSSWHLYPLRLNLERLNLDRTEFLRALHSENIGANVHYIPVYWHPYYKALGFSKGLCPIAEKEYLREISIPLFPSMTDEDVKDVCRAFDKILTICAR